MPSGPYRTAIRQRAARRACAVGAALLAATLACGAGCESIVEQDALEHYVRGQVLAEQGNTEAALSELSRAVRVHPGLAVAHTAMGDIHRKRGDFEMARGSYENACKSDPYAFRPHYNLGVTYQMLAQAAKAFERVEQYLRQAVRVYLRAIAIEPDDFEANLNVSACYFQLGQYDMAEYYCLAAIKINSRSPQAHSNLGVIYDSQDRLYDAIREYKASLELEIKQPNLLLNLGSTYMRQSRYKTAISTFEVAAKQDPNLAAAYEQMGACYFQLRYFDKAREAYEKAIALDGGSAAAYRGMGAAMMGQYVLDHNKVDLRDKALAAWYRSLELKPNQRDLIELLDKYRPKEEKPQL
ncbi:MAG TPA: tetratricopeptide repeat protein [Phycisphaerae bacterium]|nr:tetratricopeptide repeat protein [Phycisphaerae bacterium]